MEVAGQWRRQWAGTAEYGKVTEGGVTRQVARAMEVLHASAPGARVRVLRAAYHSTAGPGAAASSYMLHSSRRVISSGYNFIEPDTSPSKPLEISSTPLESSPESEVGNENYKVTEPDDFDISEPSKWRGSKSINSIRMPSEESSSTDNASVIDLDYNKSTLRKNLEKPISQSYQKRVSPISSLLDTPVTLSTLKYKSLLNGNDNWNRRKSYSFEETPELEESMLKENDFLTMESSTDSGICKSSEIVNAENYNFDNNKYVERQSKIEDLQKETFKDWLSKNRKKQYINQVQTKNEHIIGIELNDENNITLQSSGKVSIKLPTSTKTENYYEVRNSRISDEYDKRTKKVEFCRTELHFAAESGTVNIIATDDKPPPSNDFRKKRSMFVPMNNNYNKSITLFGDKTDDLRKTDSSGLTNEIITIEENTAATKGILKNKIPKPKPYLLGENMVLGDSIDLHPVPLKNDTNNNDTKPTAVTLINRQLQVERNYSNELSIGNDFDGNSFKKSSDRTTKIGPVDYRKPNQDIEQRLLRNQLTEKDVSDSVKSKVKILQMSPTPTRAKTRQLRESDLTYFGVTKTRETHNERRKHSLDSIYDENTVGDEILHSVQLVKLISNSVCNSEVDSDEAPDYENIPIKNNLTPKPAPRLRSKYHSYLDGNKEEKDLNPILEKDDETIILESRRVKIKSQAAISTNRSLSEPPKANRQKSIESPHRILNKRNKKDCSPLSKTRAGAMENSQKDKTSKIKVPDRRLSESPVYVNLGTKDPRKITVDDRKDVPTKQRSLQRQKTEKKSQITNDYPGHTKHTEARNNHNVDNINDTIKQRTDSEKQKVQQHDSERKKTSVSRTKVLVTPEKSPVKCIEISEKKHKNEDKNFHREKKLTNDSKHKHGSLKLKPPESQKNLHADRDSNEFNTSPSLTDVKALNIQQKCHKLSSDTTSTQNSLKEEQKVLLSQPKGIKMPKADKIDNKSRRSKYVINYDDKNGTVSSICKIRPDHVSTKKKKIVNDVNRDSVKNHTVIKNSSNKNNLLQLPDQQRILYGNSKTKSKIRERQSCQIL